MKALLIPLTLGTCFLALFALAEFLYHRQKIKVEYTRKLVHAGTGLITLSFPLVLTSHWQVLFLCGSFLVLLIGSKKYNYLKSINDVTRKSIGSYLFPISVYLCYVVQDVFDLKILFYLPILILAIADPAAAIIGKRFPYGKFSINGHTKTVAGSTGFLVTVLITYFLTFCVFGPWDYHNVLVHGLMLAVTTCLAEAVSKNGIDNISIPITSVIYLLLTSTL